MAITTASAFRNTAARARAGLALSVLVVAVSACSADVDTEQEPASVPQQDGQAFDSDWVEESLDDIWQCGANESDRTRSDANESDQNENERADDESDERGDEPGSP